MPSFFYFLNKYGISELAWTKRDAIDLINSIYKEPIGILGGDVYELKGDRLVSISDNWSCEKNNQETALLRK